MSTAFAVVKKEGEKYFFYYPGYDDTRKYRRSVIAGWLDGDKIHVALAKVFPGTQDTFVKTKRGGIIYNPGIKPDQFSKITGRLQAMEYARGGFWAEITSTQPEFQPRAQKLILTIEIPQGTESVGKYFVEKLEEYLKAEGFPPKVKKQPKEKAPNPEPGQVS